MLKLRFVFVFILNLQFLYISASSKRCCEYRTTTCPSTNADPHYYRVCYNGQDFTYKCPAERLYVSSNLSFCDGNYYNGCDRNLDGCVPWQSFPWKQAPSAHAPPCIEPALTKGAAYTDPSYYWRCASYLGPAQLRQCADGYGFSNNDVFVGCVPWGSWNNI